MSGRIPKRILNIRGYNNYGGGDKKQGLPPTIGVCQFAFNAIKQKAGYCKCLTKTT